MYFVVRRDDRRLDGALPAADLRQTINFNREWKFQLGDVAGADAAAFDDCEVG